MSHPAQQGYTQASQATPSQVLTVQLEDVRPFARILRGIGLKHTAVVAISTSGFEFTVEEVKTLCATAFVPVNLFQTFEFNPPPTQAPCFEISLDSLLQCLNIFGNAGSGGTGTGTEGGMKSKRRWAGEDGEGDDGAYGSGSGSRGSREKRTGMRMTWAGHGEPLSMYLQDDGKGPVTTCELATYVPESLMEQPFDFDDRCVHVIMKSEWFRDALLDLPPTSTSITLTATPAKTERAAYVAQATGSSNMRRSHRADVGNFGIKAIGTFGQTQSALLTLLLDYPNDKSVMEIFEVDEKVSFSYHSAHFAMLSRALQQSTKLAIQIQNSGFLSVQIMMPVAGNIPVGDHQGLVEFKMNPLEDGEDGDE